MATVREQPYRRKLTAAHLVRLAEELFASFPIPICPLGGRLFPCEAAALATVVDYRRQRVMTAALQPSASLPSPREQDDKHCHASTT